MKPIGLQLHTVRDYLNESKDGFLATLKRVAKIGYKGIEGGRTNLAEFGMTLADYRDLVRGLGMEFTSAPGLNPDLKNLDQVVETARVYGVKHLMTGFGKKDYENLDAIKKTAATVNKMVEALKGTGLTIALHNHFWEFIKVEGRFGADYIAELCPAVGFELDTYWAANFGENDPVAQVRKLRDRIPLLHVKDGTYGREGHPMGAPMTAVGKGKVDIPGCVNATNPDVVRFLIVEIDRCATDMWEAVEDSYRYLTEKKLGFGSV